MTDDRRYPDTMDTSLATATAAGSGGTPGASTTGSKITYTSANVDLEEFHRLFDEALAGARAASGAAHPLFIDGTPISAPGPALVDRSPIDTRLVLGEFTAATPAHVDRAVTAARHAQRDWGRHPWAVRVETMRRAASLIRERKYDLAARMSLEVGKSRLESMGDAEEAADLIDYYCQQVVDADGYVRPMARLTPTERNTDVLRPYGVFACIAPFNFPLALSTGMSAAALVAGNAVVFLENKQLEMRQAVSDFEGDGESYHTGADDDYVVPGIGHGQSRPRILATG